MTEKITRLPNVRWWHDGTYAIVPRAVVEEAQRLIDDLVVARATRNLHAEEAAIEGLAALLLEHVGQPGGGE